MTQVLKAVTYSRISADMQDRESNALDTQEQASIRFAQDEGWVIVEPVRDSTHGHRSDRSGINRLRWLLRNRSIDVVVALSPDRLSRNRTELCSLFCEAEKAGVRFEFVNQRSEQTARR